MDAVTRASSKQPGRWFRSYGGSANAYRRLICFHHAGGGPSLYREWQRSCPPDTEVWAVALPGRETRVAEPPIEHLSVAAERLAEVLPLDLPFAFFGHSLGGVVGFELARLLRERGLPQPEHLFVSASPPPQTCRRASSRGALSETELLHLLEGLGGTPKEVLDHPEIRDIVLTVLRADFHMIDNYQAPEGSTLRLPITAYAGDGDPHVPPERIQAWERWALPGFALRRFDGDHFYLARHRAALIDDVLARWDRRRIVAAAAAGA
jgi:pyochelin biosynthetic protein PchC